MPRERLECEKEIARLKKENKKLLRENEYLSHRLSRLSPKESGERSHERELFLSSQRIERSHGYFRYIFGLFKLTPIYRIYDRIFFTLRKYILASKIWRNTLIILALFGTSVQALLTFGSVLVLLPTAALCAGIFAAFSAHSYKKQKEKLLSLLKGKKIYFLYPAAKPRERGTFLESMRLFSADGAVIAVTDRPSLCAWRGAKMLYSDVYFMHTSFYFTFIKALLKRGENEIVKIF